MSFDTVSSAAGAPALRAAMLGLALLLGACADTPSQRRTPIDAGTGFKEAGLWQNAAISADAVPDAWWTLFRDPVLDQLQSEVSVGNANLQVSLAQFRAAQAAIDAARAPLFPSVGASLGVNRSANALASPRGTTYTAQAGLSNWEIDLWGRLSGSVDVARARADASRDDLAAATLSVRATLSQTYFQLRAAEAQIALLQDSVTAYQRSLQLTRNRFDAGVAASADVAQAQSQLKSTEAQLLDARSSRAQYEHAIAILLGKPPSALALPVTGRLPEPPQVPLQLPSRLLERRPDIAAAERRVAAAYAQIGVARAAFFPALTLSANGGFRGTELGTLLSAANKFWSIGPALALSLFDGGARQAGVASARAEAEQAEAAYRQVVLAALQEVEDNLVLGANLGEQSRMQSEALEAARKNLDVVTNQYQAGTVSYLNVVTAQTAALSSERAVLDARSRRLTALNQLLKNIAGRWESPS